MRYFVFYETTLEFLANLNIKLRFHIYFISFIKSESFDGSELNTILEAEDYTIIKLQWFFHIWRMSKNVITVEMQQGEFDLLQGKSLSNTGSWTNAKRDESIWMSKFLLFSVGIKSLRLKLFWLWKIFGVLC